jgi:hypothetical protein
MVTVKDLQTTPDRVCKELSEMKASQAKFERSLTSKIDNLETLLVTKDRKIQELEYRIDD